MGQLFVKLSIGLPNAPQTNRLAAKLGCGKPEALGLLVSLYAWAFQYARDGDLSKFEQGEIALACGWPGKPDKLVKALHAAGCVEGGQISDWDFVGGYAKTLEMDRLRKAAKRRQENECPVEVQRKSGGSPNIESEEIQIRFRQDSDSEKNERQREREREGERGRDWEGERVFTLFQKHYPRPNGTGDESKERQAWGKLSKQERESALLALNELRAKELPAGEIPAAVDFLGGAYLKHLPKGELKPF